MLTDMVGDTQMHIKFCHEFEIKRKYQPNFSILFSQMLSLQDNE